MLFTSFYRNTCLIYLTSADFGLVTHYLNTLRGAIRPGRKTVPKLKPYGKQLRLIASPRQSIKRRRHLMIHQLGAGVWSELKRCYHCAKTRYRY